LKKLSQIKQTTIKRIGTKFKRSKHCALWFFFLFSLYQVIYRSQGKGWNMKEKLKHLPK
jgi:hypothetical protein